MGKMHEAKNPVKGVRNAVKILEELKENDGARVSDLSAEVNLPKSSVHNYLSTLREEGFVVKKDLQYYVGLRFLDFGAYARIQYELFNVARPEVEALAEETSEMSNLMVEEQGIGVYLYRATGDQAVNVEARVGHRVKMHNTALGKAILAYKPEDEVEAILDIYGMEEMTSNTITDRDELFEELSEIRTRGVAFDMEERQQGLRCVACPIVGQDETVIGAISVSGPTSRLHGERLTEELPDLIKGAINIVELNITHI